MALERTPANWFNASTWSFHAYSYALGMLVPGMMSWNCAPITSVHASFSRAIGYGRPPSHAAATEAFSAASASSSLWRFHRFT